MNTRFLKKLVIVMAVLGQASALLTSAEDALEKGFADPPMSARPWAFWWFLGGYGNKEGMARDIAAMREKGIGGVQHTQTHAQKVPASMLPSRPKMLSDEWADWFGEAVRLTGQAGMVMHGAAVDGWGYGGWWVDAEAGCKQLVYSEVQVDGPQALARPLPQPVTFKNVYHEVAVIAFPVEANRPVPPASVTASSVAKGYCSEQNWPALHTVDGDPQTYWRSCYYGEPVLQGTAGWKQKSRTEPDALSVEHPAWLQLAYGEPLTAVGALIASMPNGGPRECELGASDDGKTFRSITRFSMAPGESKRLNFAETRARHFRLLITSAHIPDIRVAEFAVLRAGDEPVVKPGIKWWEFKSGNFGWWWWPANPYQALEEHYPEDGLKDLTATQVIDLSGKFTAAGRLEWKVPPGRWRILRFGWTSLGQHARSAGTPGGNEVDMLNVKGADLMANVPQKRMFEVAEKAAPGVLQGFHGDSWEIGANRDGQQPTWTDDFREQFQKRRGYDLLAFLPAMARYVVDDRQTTERFLRDYRDTISDLIADFYGRMQQRAHERNCLVNVQSGHGTYPYPHMDGLKNLGRADLPQTEVWHLTEVMRCSDHYCDPTRTAASGAHIYGRQIVQAEALSGSGAISTPGDFRIAMHNAFAAGLNQAVLANIDHQPSEDKPGVLFSSNISRHYPWWPMAEGYIGYLSRCQYLLQQGLFVADAAYFVGEGASRFVPGKKFLRPALPTGYDFDGINAEVLLTRASVRDGRLMLPACPAKLGQSATSGERSGDGLSYRYLVLCEPQCRTLSPAVLAKIRDLVKDGLTLVGLPPQEAPGLGERVKADAAVKALVAELWGSSSEAAGERAVGKGRVIWGRSVADTLTGDKLAPDVTATSSNRLFEIEWIHRRTDGAEIYFLANPTKEVVEAQVAFRVSGRQPQLFDPLTGTHRALPEGKAQAGCTVVPMTFAPYQAFFVVFRDLECGGLPARHSFLSDGGTPLSGARLDAPGSADDRVKPRSDKALSSQRTPDKNFPELKSVLDLAGPWEVQFDPAWFYAGGETTDCVVVFEKLVDWTKRPESAIRHYSGIATYRKKFDCNSKSPVYLSLGEVKLMARVRLNGKDLGVVWCPPWRVEITSALQPGENHLEVEVANHWGNRAIGDAALPEALRRTKGNFTLPADKLLFPSGLLGPVCVQNEKGAL
jgi:hypothetical protein